MHYYRLSIEKMETMMKLHTFYVMNTKTEMNYIQSNISKKVLHQMFNQSLNFDDNDDDDDKDDNKINENDRDFEEDKEETLADYNEIIIENYFNINNIEFQQALKVDVRVVIEEAMNYNHSDKNFNIDSLLDANFNNNK